MSGEATAISNGQVLIDRHQESHSEIALSTIEPSGRGKKGMTEWTGDDAASDGEREQQQRDQQQQRNQQQQQRNQQQQQDHSITVERPERTATTGEKNDKTQFVVDWLYRNYEENNNTSVPRSQVFNDYMMACQGRGMDPVNPATFGKVIRAVFPDLKTRRLGTRGNSKYHYFGIASAGTAAAMLEGDEPITMIVTPGPKRKMKIPPQGDAMVTNEELCIKPKVLPSPMELPFHPLIPDFEEFARFVQQICQPILEKLPKDVPSQSMQSFSQLYQNHLVHLLRLISAREFPLVEMALGMFWTGLGRELWPCLGCEEGVRIISIADDYLFQVAIHILVPDVLEPLPLPVTQSIRYFAKSLEVWIGHVFDGNIPKAIVDVKVDLARRFCQVLRRRTSLNHLAQAVRGILSSKEHLRGMLNDIAQIDFGAIREQVQWVVPGQEPFLTYLEASWKGFLVEAVSLSQWTQWLEALTEQCVSVELGTGAVSLEDATRNMMLRWSFITATLMRDLTLRSATSFGIIIGYL